MLIRLIPALLAAATTAYALKDASPFFLLSTEALPSDSLQSAQISTSSTIEHDLISAFSKCDSSLYVFIEQAGVRASDLQDATAMPQMAKRVNDKQYKGVVQIPEVIGELDADRLKAELGEKCDEQKEGNRTVVLRMRFPTLVDTESAEGRSSVLKETDAYLDQQFPALLANYTSHVLIWTSSSSASSKLDADEERHYEMDEPPFQESLHTDLKRGLEHDLKRRQSGKGQSDLPLFEKYQFLSPGIFMGLSVSLLLFIILYVGVSAIANLEVSYMAFSKEMGPQAQKKQQ
ncbi:Hypothetical predicted protein [Lecanosticta acicola]|uniref:Protein BIG1 n=1 Tax=Lecanosticta acicola TaxID=111012 RepID=A0AAI8YYZ3_9PEZI|nr:Hypothetical predicted protein [Lecanosticta acicola]